MSLRLAVAGCGRVFERLHLPAILGSQTWTLVAACDPLPSRREWVRAAASVESVHEGLTEMLAAGRADAVLVTTPPEAHADVALEALGTGLHVLVEKPIALHEDHAREVVRAAERAGRIAWTGFVRRFRAPYTELWRRLHRRPAGSWDSLATQLVVDSRWGPLAGFFGDDARGGGVLDEVASHQLDLLEWLTGTAIAEVRGLSWDTTPDQERILFQVRWPACAEAQVLSGRGGGAWEQVAVSLDGRSVLAHPAGVLERRGDLGRWARRSAALRAHTHFASCRLLGRPNATGHSFRLQLQAFADAVRGASGLPGADAAAGLRSLQATLALRESFRRGGAWVAPGDAS